MNYNLLLVEDDVDLASTIIEYLALEQIYCDHASNGMLAMELLQQHQFDVVILDINMPHMDGINVCKKMRELGLTTPILMLTARDTLEDKLAGFSAGTDDYLVKPFAMLELIARVQVLAQRISGQVNILSMHGVELNFTEKLAYRNSRKLALTPTGWNILEMLMRKANTVVSRQQLVRNIWGDFSPESNSLKVHLFKLRQQLNQNDAFELIHTIPGQGLIFKNKND
jgi:DNA-binding response OmpR family regulator